MAQIVTSIREALFENSQDIANNTIVINPEQLAIGALFIGGFMFLVFLSFQAVSVYTSYNRKRSDHAHERISEKPDLFSLSTNKT